MTGTIAELRVGLEDFALKHSLETVTGLSCQVERVVATDPETLMPFLWVETPQSALTELEDAFATDDTIDQVDCITDLDEERLYQMQWVENVDLLVQIFVEEDGTVLSASGTAEGWHLRLLFPTRDALSRTHDYCRSNGIDCELLTIYNVDEGRRGRFGLTDAQQDTMTAAFERGYYEIPRELNTEELAAEFDISHQALSERLRRGHKALVKNTLMIGPRGTNGDREIQTQ
ncbi:bacterio-opsin activator domain-containing protein [Saliphagus infecundisoli]|uniref:Bacterio-opsin activator domain-containing protein n=1 Tax=Saliphagus infecundisoli TaxID=1849069 RepID=A0ABD5QDS1_9EURY|nr:helix-turn-helix domain-containing protein [Saliphagus infecundisoli]